MIKTRIDIINSLIKKFNYKKYLEIGVRKGDCISKITAPHKDGVDPEFSLYTNFVMTSDDFFKSINKDTKYDIVFIDGLHTYSQVKKDIINSLNYISDNGTILLHDSNPQTEDAASEVKISTVWNGTVYKAIIDLRINRDDLEIFTINADQGVCVIRKGKQNKLNFNLDDCLNYDFFSKNRKECLNLISVNDFIIWINS